MMRLLQEPLVQLLAGGAVIFGLYAAFGVDEGGGAEGSGPSPAQVDRRIVVDDALEKRLSADFQRRFGRAPGATDLKLLVDRFVDDEVLYREALANGMSAGDQVVRQRLIQKMRLALDDATTARPLSEAEVKAYYDAHQDRYPAAATVSLKHVFVGDTASAGLLEQLRSGAVKPEQAGKPFGRGTTFRAHTPQKLAAIFGKAFVAALEKAPLKQWSGPLTSSLGKHLVLVEERTAAGTQPLSKVRKRVERDLRRKRRNQGEGLERLKKRFEIVRP